jgi:phage terminase large subunit-like protein
MLAELFDSETIAEFNAQSEHDRIAYIAHAKWVASAHRYQIPPPLEVDYTVWMMLAGRGAGKTRSAAEA